jgi:hypothetical protein
MGYMICRHIMPGGRKCDAPALRDMPYCFFHLKLHQKLHNRRAEAKAETATTPVDAEFIVPDIEDRISIQLAISEVIQALASNKITFQRAGRLFYGLQLAAQAVEHTRNEYTGYSVRAVSTTENGDELGPEEFMCEDKDNCNKCPYSVPGKCDRWHFIDKKKEDADADADDDNDDDDEDDDDDNDDE